MKVLASFLFSILLTGAAARADIPSTHGMVVFGGATATYASHLPMFHAPHDYQLLLKIALKGVPGSQALDAYAVAKYAGKTLFTLEPQIMDLEKIMSGTKTEFIAAIYEGHFERGGQNLGNLKVQIEKIVFSSKLNSHTPPQQNEKYFVFGEKGAYFAAHIIQGKPSFDAILEVSQPYEIYLPYCRTRVCAEPTKTVIPDEKLPLALVGPGDVQSLQVPASGDLALQLGDLFGGITDVMNVLYVEEGDLSH
jgi:hypothetical protein